MTAATDETTTGAPAATTETAAAAPATSEVETKGDAVTEPTGAEATTGTSPAGEADAAEPTAEAFDLNLDGELADPEIRAKLVGSLKDAGLDAEKAQKMLDGFLPAMRERQAVLADERTKEWKADLLETLRADKEFVGKDGSKFDAAVETRNAGIVKAGGKELLKWLEDSGLINQPGIAKAFRWVGERVSGDPFVAGGSTTSAPSPIRNGDIHAGEASKLLYPNMKL